MVDTERGLCREPRTLRGRLGQYIGRFFFFSGESERGVAPQPADPAREPGGWKNCYVTARLYGMVLCGTRTMYSGFTCPAVEAL